MATISMSSSVRPLSFRPLGEVGPGCAAAGDADLLALDALWIGGDARVDSTDDADPVDVLGVEASLLYGAMSLVSKPPARCGATPVPPLTAPNSACPASRPAAISAPPPRSGHRRSGHGRPRGRSPGPRRSAGEPCCYHQEVQSWNSTSSSMASVVSDGLVLHGFGGVSPESAGQRWVVSTHCHCRTQRQSVAMLNSSASKFLILALP